MFDQRLLRELRAAGYTPAAWRGYVVGHMQQARRLVDAHPSGARSILATGFAVLLLVFAAAAAVAITLDAELGRRLFVDCAVWLAGHCAWLLLHLGLLVDPRRRPLLRLGSANTITLLRSVSIPALVVFMQSGHLMLGFVVFLAGAVSDVVDGALARRTGTVSRMGIVTDPLVDVAWNTAAVYGLVAAGMVPAWVLGLTLVRYVALLSGSCILYLLRSTVRIRPTLFGKASGLAIGAVITFAYVSRLALPAAVSKPLDGIIVAALGFLFSATIVYVVVLGVLNSRSSARNRPVGKVVGHLEDRRASGGPHGQ